MGAFVRRKAPNPKPCQQLIQEYKYCITMNTGLKGPFPRPYQQPHMYSITMDTAFCSMLSSVHSEGPIFQGSLLSRHLSFSTSLSPFPQSKYFYYFGSRSPSHIHISTSLHQLLIGRRLLVAIESGQPVVWPLGESHEGRNRCARLIVIRATVGTVR
jgi:hypothetical protein